MSKRNKSAALDWTLGISGAAVMAGGAWMLADASKVYPDDPTGRQYNEYGPSGAKGVGVGALVLGGLAAGVAITDAVRATGTDTRSSEATETVPVERCVGEPVAGAEVSGSFKGHAGEETFAIGVTGADGVVDLRGGELSRPRSVRCAYRTEVLTSLSADLLVSVSGERGGTLPMQLVNDEWRRTDAERETRLKAAAVSSLEACSRGGLDCETVWRYQAEGCGTDDELRGKIMRLQTSKRIEGNDRMTVALWTATLRDGATACSSASEPGACGALLRHIRKAGATAQSSELRPPLEQAAIVVEANTGAELTRQVERLVSDCANPAPQLLDTCAVRAKQVLDDIERAGSPAIAGRRAVVPDAAARVDRLGRQLAKLESALRARAKEREGASAARHAARPDPRDEQIAELRAQNDASAREVEATRRAASDETSRKEREKRDAEDRQRSKVLVCRNTCASDQSRCERFVYETKQKCHEACRSGSNQGQCSIPCERTGERAKRECEESSDSCRRRCDP